MVLVRCVDYLSGGFVAIRASDGRVIALTSKASVRRGEPSVRPIGITVASAVRVTKDIDDERREANA